MLRSTLAARESTCGHNGRIIRAPALREPELAHLSCTFVDALLPKKNGLIFEEHLERFGICKWLQINSLQNHIVIEDDQVRVVAQNEQNG